MNDIFRVLQILKSRKTERFALATVIGVEGSAYRHEGAKMLIDEENNLYGMISGGCLEEDIIHHANEVLQSGKPKIVTYGNQSVDDLSWGEWSGCNGSIDVYIEETGWDILKDRNGRSLWEVINQKLLSGYRVASIKFIDVKNNYKAGIYYCEDKEVLHCSNDLDKELLSYLKTFIMQEKNTEMTTIENKWKLFTELYKPMEALYIFGAGPDIEPLVKVVSKLDFSIRLIDPRSARFAKGNFAAVDQIVIEFPHIYLQQNDISENSFVLIMTHNFHWDRSILEHLVKKPPQYIGILGSKKRTERLFYPDPVPEWIHSPVGVDIFAEGPEEIAISICAELIKRGNSVTKKNQTKPSEGKTTLGVKTKLTQSE